MIESSRAHLRAAGESYFEHMHFAASVAALAIGAGVACLLHAMVPALCQRTCSRTLGHLQLLFRDRGQLKAVREEGGGVLAFTGLLLLCLATAGGLVIAVGPTVPTNALIVCTFAMPAAYLLANSEMDCLEE